MAPPAKPPELLALAARAHAIGRRIRAPASAYPPFGVRRDGGYPNVLRRDDAWVWEVHERGELLERRTSESEDDVLYWIFKDVTRSMATRRRIELRLPDLGRRTDSRIGWASRQLALLRALDPRWESRFRREEDSWLRTIDLPAQLPPPD